MTIYSITALWNNDGDHGIGVMFQGGDLEAIERKIVDRCEDDGQHNAIMLALLSDYTSRKETLTLDEQVEVACLIGALEHHGVIVGDEYNGLLIMREIPRIQDGQHRTIH